MRSLSSQTQFLSLLYYLGLLTIGKQPPDMPPSVFGYRLEIPNRVIRELIWEHLAMMLKDEAHLAIDTRDIEVVFVGTKKPQFRPWPAPAKKEVPPRVKQGNRARRSPARRG